jgi:ribonuclease D
VISSPVVITSEEGVTALSRRLARAERVGLDLESDGLHAYRAKVCTMQLAFDGEVAIVDALATSLTPLAEALGPAGPVKIIHDVAFDARLLGERGIALGNVHDTAIAARMLGRTATGLATLVAAYLGITVSKELQQHDWRVRPLAEETLAYLAGDVLHLAQLDDSLFGEVRACGIEAEVLEETRYRLAGALTAVGAPDERPPYVRLKGIDRLHGQKLAVVRRLAQVREQEAARRDVPPQRVLPAEVLFTISRDRPATLAQLWRAHSTLKNASEELGRALLAAVAEGLTESGIPDAERIYFERPRLAPEVIKARKQREGRLTAWRRGVAKERGVDEQVVLPGHCVKDIAEAAPTTLEELARTPGIGVFRVERDGPAILRALVEGPEAEAAP